MDISYAIAPLVAWLVAGCLKFMINSLKARKLAFGQIGYGGLPSNHSAMVTSTAALIAIRLGIDSPVFGVALTLAVIVMLDANSLRYQIGEHAIAINRLMSPSPNNFETQGSQRVPLRERIGHTRTEIAAGIGVGIMVALVVSAVVRTS